MSNETNFHEIRQILLNKYHINIVFKKMNEMVAGPRLNGHCFEQVKKTQFFFINEGPLIMKKPRSPANKVLDYQKGFKV